MSQREQQTARVNVDDATWQAFRIRAIRANRSVADELARLVRNDLRRARPSDAPRPSAARTYADRARRMAMTFERITTDPEVLGGVPCIRGLRVPVATVVGMVADGMTADEILADFPYLEPDDIAAALRYAAEAVRSVSCRCVRWDEVPGRREHVAGRRPGLREAGHDAVHVGEVLRLNASLGGIVTSQSIRIGGDELDESIIGYVKKEYSLLLGERTAEELKMAIGSAFPLPDEPHAEIRGRDLVSGMPKTIIVSAVEIRKAIEEPVNAIVDAVKNTLDRTPPELAADIMDKGIVLTGGGALLKGLDERLKHETGLPIHTTEDPLSSVAIGSGKCLEEFDALKRVLVSSSRR
jgi:uncharacterized protein (DUF433 family)